MRERPGSSEGAAEQSGGSGPGGRGPGRPGARAIRPGSAQAVQGQAPQRQSGGQDPPGRPGHPHGAGQQVGQGPIRRQDRLRVGGQAGQQPPQEEKPQEEKPQAQRYEVLEPGDTGEAVKKLQRRLKALEWFSGEIGGNYKTLTTQAVKDFQKAAGLPQTGVADSATQAALYAQDAPDNKLDNRGETAPGKSKRWTGGPAASRKFSPGARPPRSPT